MPEAPMHTIPQIPDTNISAQSPHTDIAPKIHFDFIPPESGIAFLTQHFQELFAKLTGYICRNQKMYNKETAEDIAQETLTALFQNLENGAVKMTADSVEASINKLLFLFCKRAIIDKLRLNNAQKRGDSEAHITFYELKYDDRKNQPTPVDIYDALEVFGKIHPRAAKVVYLCYFEGHTFKEIARKLKTSEATVKRDWQLAKTCLYTYISQQKSSQ